MERRDPHRLETDSSLSGDLNRDGRTDAVLVMQQTDPAKVVTNPALGPDTLDLNPRRLLIMLQTPSGWKTVTLTDRFLPAPQDADIPCQDDPLAEGGISIIKGILQIDLHYWLSCGSYGVTHHTFKFRYEDSASRFRMIGLDRREFMRNSGDMTEYSHNYLSGKQKITTGLNAFDETSRPKTTWRAIKPPVKRYLDEMTSSCSTGDIPAGCP